MKFGSVGTAARIGKTWMTDSSAPNLVAISLAAERACSDPSLKSVGQRILSTLYMQSLLLAGETMNNRPRGFGNLPRGDWCMPRENPNPGPTGCFTFCVKTF